MFAIDCNELLIHTQYSNKNSIVILDAAVFFIHLFEHVANQTRRAYGQPLSCIAKQGARVSSMHYFLMTILYIHDYQSAGILFSISQ